MALLVLGAFLALTDKCYLPRSLGLIEPRYITTGLLLVTGAARSLLASLAVQGTFEGLI